MLNAETNTEKRAGRLYLYRLILLYMISDQAFVQKGPASTKRCNKGSSNYELIQYGHNMIVAFCSLLL